MYKKLTNYFSHGGGLKTNEYDTSLSRNPFSHWFPYVAYDDIDGSYLNDDGSYGFIYECDPHAFSGLREINILEGMLSKRYPDNTLIQVSLFADNNINDFLQRYESSKTRAEDLIKKNIEELSRHYLKNTEGSPQLNGIPVRNFRLLFSIKSADKLPIDIVANFRDALIGAKLNPRPVNAGELLSYLRCIINGNKSFNETHYDQLMPLNKQIVNAETVIKFDDQSELDLQLGDRFARCLTPKLLPGSTNILKANKMVGGIMGVEDDSEQINAPFLFNVTILPESGFKSEIQKKAQIMMAQRPASSVSAQLKKRVEELSWALDKVENTEFVRIIPSLWIFGESKEHVRDVTSTAKRIWESSHDFLMQEERGYSLTVMLFLSLPFGLRITKDNINLLERDFPVSVDAAVRMIPIQADFKGTSNAILPFVGRKGQVIGIDLFDKRVNNHNFLITAGSGSGKSFTLNYIVANYFASGALIRLIDVGYSYKKLCSIVGGRYLDFGKEHICINPFHSMANDAEDRSNDMQATANVLSEMVYSASGQQMTETEWTLIKDAVTWAINEDGGEYGVDGVYRYLSQYPTYVDDKEKVTEAISTLAKVMAFNLRDFVTGGRYGRYFNGKTTFDISNDEFVVLELEKLKSQKELFKVVTLQVANACTQDLYQSDRERKRFILFEEAYQFFKKESGAHNQGNERIGQIIEEGYRRARKYGGSFGIVTQSMNDLKSFGSSGAVIRNNSAFKILLEADDYEEAGRDGAINYEGLALELLKSVRNNKPKYSEIFFDTPYGMGIGRLFVDKWTYWINTSEASEVRAYEKLTTNNKTPLEALTELSGI